MSNPMMSHGFYRYVNSTFEKLSDQINDFIHNYRPCNLTIPGNTVLGSNDCDQLTVNAESQFNGDVEANIVRINNLTVFDNTVVGQDDTDILTINSSTTFAGSAVFNDVFHVVGNTMLGTDTTNTVTSTGSIVTQHLNIPLVPDNSLNLGCMPIVLYVERNVNTNLYEEFSDSIILKIKNTAITGKLITSGPESSEVIPAGTTYTYLKVNLNTFVRIN